MSGPPRSPDKLNTIGVVVVGICGAVLVYVSIVALQAFYMNNSSEVRTMADYGGNDTTARSIKASQQSGIGEFGINPADPNKKDAPQTFRVPIDHAMAAIVADAKTDPAMLVPAVGRSETATVQPIYGRPKLIPVPVAPPAVDGAGSAADPGAGSAATPAPAGTPPAPTPAPATPTPAPAAPTGNAPAN